MILYHGTNFNNLVGVLTRGLVPSGGYSPHRTKTRNAIFLTDSMEGALAYSTASDNLAIILEINTENLPIEPDYDDIGLKLDVELEEINRYVSSKRILKIGSKVSEKVAEEIEHLQELYAGESPEPSIISIKNGRIYAEPYVFFGINDEYYNEIPELYDDSEISFSESGPGIVIRQYLCYCTANIFNIKYIWLNITAIEKIGININYNQGKTIVTDYWNFEKIDDEINFRKVELFAFLPHHLAAIL